MPNEIRFADLRARPPRYVTVTFRLAAAGLELTELSLTRRHRAEQSNGMTMVGDRHRYAGAFDLYRITLSFAVTSAIVTVLAMTRRR